MNILKRYIKQANKRREKYAYILINLYDYARLGELDLNKRLTDEEKNNWNKKANEYRDEIAKLIMKGLK
jgi:hypothetical protein